MPRCRVLADDVERWAADEPVTAWREPFAWRARRWARRNGTIVTAAAAAVLVGAGRPGRARLSVQAKANLVLTCKNAELIQAIRRESEANVALVAANAKAQRGSTWRLRRSAPFAGVSEDLLLKEKRFEALRDKLLGGAMRFYDRLGAPLEGESDWRSRRSLGQAHHEVGKLTNIIGQPTRHSPRIAGTGRAPPAGRGGRYPTTRPAPT